VWTLFPLWLKAKTSGEIFFTVSSRPHKNAARERRNEKNSSNTHAENMFALQSSSGLSGARLFLSSVKITSGKIFILPD
jgi:hypothetical protein